MRSYKAVPFQMVLLSLKIAALKPLGVEYARGSRVWAGDSRLKVG